MLLVKEMSFPVFQLLELNCLGVYWNSCDQPIATLDAQTMIVSWGGGGGGGGGVDEGGEEGVKEGELNSLGVYWNSCDQPIATLDAQTMIVSW